MNKYFGAFIITYERPEILPDTIDRILGQTYPPEKILIVDNSETDRTDHLIKSLNHPKLEYYRTGYNAGPAGGAAIGLQRLTEEGYQWIYWGDDNDPPMFPDCFEIIFSNLINTQNPGMIGAVGHKVNHNALFIERTPDALITASGMLEVDYIAGGMCLLVNCNLVKGGILPHAPLFFCFEDLDYAIRAKRQGFRLWVSAELFRRYRQHSRRPLLLAGKRGLKKDPNSLWREYYSTRNLLFIARQNKLYPAWCIIFFTSVLKLIYNYRYGIVYGNSNFRIVFSGLFDSIQNKMGKRNLR